MFSFNDVFAVWAFVWAWIVANPAMVVATVSTVVVSVPVLYFSVKALRHACQEGGIMSRILANLRRLAPGLSAVREPRDPMEILEEGLSFPPLSVIQLTFKRLSPQLRRAELRMIRTVKSMYVMLDQTLLGPASSSSKNPMDSMNDACFIVARTVATLVSWGASTPVMSLVNPAKDVTSLFSDRAKRNGYGGMSRGRQTHFVALLHRRATAMEEVIEQALWAGTMPEIPVGLRDVTSIIGLLERDDRINAGRVNGAGRGNISKGKGTVESGVEFIPYSSPSTNAEPCASHVPDSGIGLSWQ
ncbi:unnamed protein product [Ectocarpus sp. 4 AP-2014]